MTQATQRVAAASLGLRAAISTMPRRAWFAVIGLVLLATAGLSFVIDAGVSAWRIGVSGAPSVSPRVVVEAPRTAIVVVPTPHTSAAAPQRPAAAPAPALAPAPAQPVVRVVTVVPSAASTGSASGAPPAAAPTPLVNPPSTPAPVARPRLVVGATQHDKGRHVGWVKQAARAAGESVTSARALVTPLPAAATTSHGNGHPKGHAKGHLKGHAKGHAHKHRH